MEAIRSRQNELVKQFSRLAASAEARREQGLFIGAGKKLLDEAVKSGAEVAMALSCEELPGFAYRLVTRDILDYVSPLQNSPGPVFAVRMREKIVSGTRHAIVLENLQDPGNVGTVLRTADALGVDLVVLCGACADPYSPKTVRASMGAIFRQSFVKCTPETLRSMLGGLPLYGAMLSERARDIRSLEKKPLAIAIGNEGRGLTQELLAQCEGEVIIPMQPQAESLNAAVAAALCMWELVR